MGDAYDPEADETLAELVNASIAKGFALEAQLRTDSEMVADPRLRAFYVRMSEYIGASALLGDHLTKRQRMERMALSFTINGINALTERVRKVEDRPPQQQGEPTLAPVPWWRLWQRYFDASALRSTIQALESDVATMQARQGDFRRTLRTVEQRLSVWHKWEEDEINAPRGVEPRSKRLDALTVALIDVVRARTRCEMGEEIH